MGGVDPSTVNQGTSKPSELPKKKWEKLRMELTHLVLLKTLFMDGTVCDTPKNGVNDP